MEQTNQSQTLNMLDKVTFSERWLSTVITLWISIVLIGQWMFAFYILAQFAKPLFTGMLDESQFSHMIKGYINGDTFNNAVLLLHIIPVFLIGLSSTFQLVPYIRNRFPTFHRFNGRLFLSIGLIGALTGLYLTWIRDTRLSDIGAYGITLNGLLIPIAVILAWHFAVQRRFDLHRRLAVHAFILINGVWTFRLFLMGWFMINQGSLGNNSTLDGPADLTFSYACYLLPMAVAEVVFWAERKAQHYATVVAASVVSLATVVTFIGVVSASMMMWWPRISAAL